MYVLSIDWYQFLLIICKILNSVLNLSLRCQIISFDDISFEKQGFFGGFLFLLWCIYIYLKNPQIKFTESLYPIKGSHWLGVPNFPIDILLQNCYQTLSDFKLNFHNHQFDWSVIKQKLSYSQDQMADLIWCFLIWCFWYINGATIGDDINIVI